VKLIFVKYTPKQTNIGFVLQSRSLRVNESGGLRLGEFVNIAACLGGLA